MKHNDEAANLERSATLSKSYETSTSSLGKNKFCCERTRAHLLALSASGSLARPENFVCCDLIKTHLPVTGDHFAFWVEEVGDGADGIVHVEFLRAVAPGRVAREVQLRVFAQVNRHHAARCRLRSCLHRLRSNFHDLQPCTVIAAATEIV